MSKPVEQIVIKLPPPVRDGTYIVEDLGRFVNWITRARHTQRKVDEALEASSLLMNEAEWEALGGDPAPVAPPPPEECVLNARRTERIADARE